MSTQVRAANIRKAAEIVLQTAKLLHLLPEENFDLIVKVGRAKGVHGGTDRDGRPLIAMSTHTRYHDVVAYATEWVSKHDTTRMKSNWARAAHQFMQTGIPRVVEYASFDRDPVIGGINTDDNWVALLLSTCHEVAHAIVLRKYFLQRWDNNNYHSRPQPHGKEWRTVYGKLRQALVNPHIAGVHGNPPAPQENDMVNQVPKSTPATPKPAPKKAAAKRKPAAKKKVAKKVATKKVTTKKVTTKKAAVKKVQAAAKKVTTKKVPAPKKVAAKQPATTFKHTREGSAMYTIIEALLVGGTINELADRCKLAKGSISASISSHIPKKGYVVKRSDAGVYKITNAKVVH